MLKQDLKYIYRQPRNEKQNKTKQNKKLRGRPTQYMRTKERVYRAIEVKEQAISSDPGSDSGYSLQSYKTSMGIAEAVIT